MKNVPGIIIDALNDSSFIIGTIVVLLLTTIQANLLFKNRTRQRDIDKAFILGCFMGFIIISSLTLCLFLSILGPTNQQSFRIFAARITIDFLVIVAVHTIVMRKKRINFVRKLNNIAI